MVHYDNYDNTQPGNAQWHTSLNLCACVDDDTTLQEILQQTSEFKNKCSFFTITSTTTTLCQATDDTFVHARTLSTGRYAQKRVHYDA